MRLHLNAVWFQAVEEKQIIINRMRTASELQNNHIW
jgi:hypothetical protein